jgi:NADH:ubiquinone oxidoreductase subunit F (NADH-binding)
MTATMDRTAPTGSAWSIGTPRLLAGLERHAVLDLPTHVSVHGPMPATDHGHLLGVLDASALAGRGGAGFPFATKIRALRGNRTRVVVNGAESEPASHKDRTLLLRAPHLVLDGALAVSRPGVVELPLGTPLGIVLSAAGALDPQAVVIGGYHGSWHAPLGGIQLSRAGMASAGGTFGAGVVLVLGRQTCALGELGRVAHWLAGQSAKQCGPCRFGLPQLAADVEALYRGDAPALAAALNHSRLVVGRGACGHPDGAARFVTSGMHVLRDEIDAHLRGGCGRPLARQLPLGG